MWHGKLFYTSTSHSINPCLTAFMSRSSLGSSELLCCVYSMSKIIYHRWELLHSVKEMVACINKGLLYIIMHLPFTSIRWKVIDKSLAGWLILSIVNISLENVKVYILATIKKIKTHTNILPAYLPAWLPSCLPACLPVCLSACLPACLPDCLPACMHVCMSACMSACLPACLAACLHVCLPACCEIYQLRSLSKGWESLSYYINCCSLICTMALISQSVISGGGHTMVEIYKQKNIWKWHYETTLQVVRASRRNTIICYEKRCIYKING